MLVCNVQPFTNVIQILYLTLTVENTLYRITNIELLFCFFFKFSKFYRNNDVVVYFSITGRYSGHTRFGTGKKKRKEEKRV